MAFRISKERGDKIPQELIGLFFEDINYAADGGLFAEMIENRSFEAKEAFGTPGTFYSVDDPGYAWSAYSENETMPRLQIISGAPLSSVNPHYLRCTASGAGQGFSNKAYDGMNLKKGMTYHVSFYARCVDFTGESCTVKMIKDQKTVGEGCVKFTLPMPYMPFADLAKPTVSMEESESDSEWDQMIRRAIKMKDPQKCRQNDWIRYRVDIAATENVRGALFVLTLNGTGAVDFDLISVIPEDAVAGIFRKDLFDALKELNPGFIRFPGGCIIEGISLDNRYQWKDTVGEWKDRRYQPNLWAFDDDRSREKEGLDVQRPTSSHYGQSYGIGFYEYFLLCELLGAKPLPVLNIGAACQFRSTEIVPVDSPEFGQYLQDALDLVEFANGPADSKWGSLRAEMGHPEPFGLTMVSAGNEQWETEYFDFYERADRFEKAIHAKYPEIRMIGSAGPNVETPMYEEAWAFYRGRQTGKTAGTYAVDEHYYVSPAWMYDHVNFYDSYPDTVGVFAGEYAAHTKDRENSMEAALAEAAMLTGIEKNVHAVKLASYAPLFNRIGYSQWKPDMIWFDDANVYLTPNYQVQKLFANNLGDETIPMQGQEKELQKDKIYVSLSRKEGGEIILKAVNAGEKDYTLDLADVEGKPVQAKAKVQTLASAGEMTKDLPEPSEVRTEQIAMNGSIVLPAGTFRVVRF